MACPTIFDGLRIATEFLGDEIHRYSSPGTPYYNFITRGMFPKNKGVNMTTFTVGRIEPTSTSMWSDVSLSNNVITGGACADSFTNVPVGFAEVTYAPRKMQLSGPVICRDQLTYAHDPVAFIQGRYIPGLGNYVKRVIDMEFRARSIAFSNKVSITTSNTFNNIFTGTTLPTVKPSSQVTWDHLDQIAVRLISAGAMNNDQLTIEWGPDGPMFTVFMGIEMLNRLFTNVSAIRQDFNYATMGKDTKAATILPIGAGRRYKNFRFVPIVNPPRYTWNNTTLVEIQQFADFSNTHGTSQQETTAYQQSEYEGFVVVNENQWKADVVTPETAGLDFDISGYNGDWRFVTGGMKIASNSQCFDPLEKFGQHFAEFTYAPEPIHPEFGWAGFYKRCNNDQTGAACTSGS